MNTNVDVKSTQTLCIALVRMMFLPAHGFSKWICLNSIKNYLKNIFKFILFLKKKKKNKNKSDIIGTAVCAPFTAKPHTLINKLPWSIDDHRITTIISRLSPLCSVDDTQSFISSFTSNTTLLSRMSSEPALMRSFEQFDSVVKTAVVCACVELLLCQPFDNDNACVDIGASLTRCAMKLMTGDVINRVF